MLKNSTFLETFLVDLRAFFLLDQGEFKDFISTATHPPLFSRMRARFILSRVRMVAAAFAILTPIWIGIDFITLPQRIALDIAIGRLICTIAFILLVIICRCQPSIRNSKIAIGILYSIPTAFFIYSRFILAHLHLNSLGTAMEAGYTFLPFVLITGLSLFPLTITETLIFTIPMLSAFAISNLLHTSGLLPGLKDIVVMWLLFLIAIVGDFASLSQLQLMKDLFKQSSFDPLVGTLNRRSGEQYLEIMMNQAQRHHFPFAIAFLDLDDFKSINDQFGHDAGDHALIETALTLKSTLRKGDSVIRWGGEEFIVAMPYCTAEQIAHRINDMFRLSHLKRPDGTALTLSGGIAQWPRDAASDWSVLVACADKRMYIAKSTGKAHLETTSTC